MNPMFLTFAGESRAGATPVQVIADGVVTADQLQEVEAYYVTFDASCRVSIAQQHRRAVVLSDGSAARFERSFGIDRVFIRPVAPSTDERMLVPVAWPAYPDLAFSPAVYTRPVVDMGTYTPQQYPPEPTYPGAAPYSVPEPTYTAPNVIVYYYYWVNREAYNVYTGAITNGVRKATYADIVAATGNDTLTTSSGLADPYAGTTPVFSTQTTYATFGTLVASYTYGGGSSTTQLAGERSAWDAVLADEAADASARAAAIAANNAAYTAFLATYDAWANARNAYYAADLANWKNTVYKAWQDACAALDAEYPERTGGGLLKSLRSQARPGQIAAVAAWLDSGVATPHLVARYLSFPWTVASAHTASFSPGAGTDTGHDQITDGSNGASFQITHTVVNGNVNTVATETYADGIAQGQMALPAGWKLGGNVARQNNLFGWLANGDYVRYKRLYPFHVQERPQVRPGDLSTLTFSAAAGYVDFVNSPIGATSNTSARINSDAFVPPGTVVTLAQLEYEVYDPYSQAWLWMPYVDLRSFDAIWLVSAGQFTVPAIPDAQSAGVSPRNVRVRRVLRQTRRADWTWSTPAEVPAGQMRKTELPTFPLTSLWTNYPSTIVIAVNLHRAATPRADQNPSLFPYGEAAAYPGTSLGMVNEALSAWSGASSLYTLTAKVLNHIYKVAP